MIRSDPSTGAGTADQDYSPLIRWAEPEIDSARIHSYKRLLAEEIEASVRVETEVLALYAVSVKGKPASIRIMEIYADRAAYEAHLSSPHFLKYKAETSEMALSRVLMEADPISVCAKGVPANDRWGAQLAHTIPSS